MAIVKGMTPDKLTQKAAYTQNKANKLGLNLNDVTSFAGMSPEQSLNLIAKSRKELAGLSKPTTAGNVVDMSNVNFGGTPTTPSTITAPTFNADDYYKKGATGLTDLATKQKELTLAQLRAARDKSIGDINLLKQDVTPAYQQKRDETDFQSKLAANRLREMMEAQGLANSGKNVTEQMRLNATNQNNLNDLNLQERRTLDDFDKQIRDIMDPSQEQNIIGQADLELMRQLNDLRMRADDRAYDNDWRTADFTRQGLWHDDEVNFRNTQFDYTKGQDAIANKLAQDTFDLNKSNSNVSNGMRSRDMILNIANMVGYVTPDLAKIYPNLKVGTPFHSTKMDNEQLALAKKKVTSSGSSGGGSRGGSRGYSSSGSSSSGGSTPTKNQYMQAVNNQEARFEFFRSKADIDAEFRENKAHIIKQVGPEGYQYLLQKIQSLPDNFIGSIWTRKHTGKK